MLPRWQISLAYEDPETGWQHDGPLTGWMTDRESPPGKTRRIPIVAVAALLVVSAIIAASRDDAISSSASASLPASSSRPAASRVPVRRTDHPAALGETDGVVPDGTTVFDDQIPGVGNLDLALRAALRKAATDAARDEVDIFVTSGWRSRAYQVQLFRDAVSKYGSTAKAARWVATPGTSAHESGKAVDIGAFDAMAWLAQHGAAYGLCQTYHNEPWHYELRPAAVRDGCPPPYADPTDDSAVSQ
jgi:hypothetical protein